MTVGSNTRKAPRCFECGINAYMKSQREMANRSGPTFDRWLAGVMKFAHGDSQTPPPPVE